MRGQKLGYIRVSSSNQNIGRQLDDLELDRCFTDKVSASTTNRPSLKECLEYVRQGDILYCHSIDRLARNLRDLQDIIKTLTDKGVTVEFHKEGLTFNGKEDSLNKLMLQMMGAFAEFERSLIRERQAEGIKKAKQAGKRFGQPPKLSADQVTKVKQMAADRHSKTEIAKRFGISRQTVYNALNS